MPTVVSHKHKLIFAHIPRTGGTSVFNAIKPHLGDKDLFDGPIETHVTMRLLKTCLRPRGALKEYKKFSIVRNPLYRFLSQFQGVLDRSTIEQVVSDLLRKVKRNDHDYWRSATEYLCDGQDMMVDKVFKLEDGFDSVVQFLNASGIPVEKIGKDNIGKKSNGKMSYYQEQLYSLEPWVFEGIKQVYREDYERFGYVES